MSDTRPKRSIAIPSRYNDFDGVKVAKRNVDAASKGSPLTTRSRASGLRNHNTPSPDKHKTKNNKNDERRKSNTGEKSDTVNDGNKKKFNSSTVNTTPVISRRTRHVSRKIKIAAKGRLSDSNMNDETSGVGCEISSSGASGEKADEAKNPKQNKPPNEQTSHSKIFKTNVPTTQKQDPVKRKRGRPRKYPRPEELNIPKEIPPNWKEPSISKNSLEEWKIIELKQALRGRKLSYEGKKKELIDRLYDAMLRERNTNQVVKRSETVLRRRSRLTYRRGQKRAFSSTIDDTTDDEGLNAQEQMNDQPQKENQNHVERTNEHCDDSDVHEDEGAEEDHAKSLKTYARRRTATSKLTATTPSIPSSPTSTSSIHSKYSLLSSSPVSSKHHKVIEQNDLRNSFQSFYYNYHSNSHRQNHVEGDDDDDENDDDDTVGNNDGSDSEDVLEDIPQKRRRYKNHGGKRGKRTGSNHENRNMGSSNADQKCDTYIKDCQLLSAVLEHLKKKGINVSDGTLTMEQLSSVSVLQNFSIFGEKNVPIKNLEGLQHCTNIREINFAGNRIRKIDILSNLNNLSHLWLSKNRIIEITALSQLSNQLVCLDLSLNIIQDLTALRTLQKIRYLNLSSNLLKDISPLAELPELQELNISNNKISDISCLNDFRSSGTLKTLDATNNMIEDLQPISSLCCIKELYLSYNSFIDITPLCYLTRLMEVDLTVNAVLKRLSEEQITKNAACVEKLRSSGVNVVV